jgi:hypothetical protein
MIMKHNRCTNRNRMIASSDAKPTRHLAAPSFLGRTLGVLGCASLLLLAGVSASFAQFAVSLTANPIRITVPISSTGSYTNTVTVTISNPDAVSSVTLAATGFPGSSSVSFDKTVFTNSGTATMIVSYANVPQGQYDSAVAATGSAAYRLPIPMQAGYQWNSLASAGNLTNAANWVGNVAPGAADTIIIPDVTFGNNSTPSILVTSDTTIGAVRDVHNGNSTYPNFNIAAGATLSITGDGGYQQLRDTLTSNSRAYVQASGAGTLLVSNANANFDLIVYAENTQNYFLFDQLNTLKLDVNRITIDDILAYPDYQTNGTTTYPRRWSPRFYLAMTNIFRATLTDANSWTNQARNYSFVIDRNRAGNGSGTRFGMRFGLQNQFYCDSMLWCGSGSSCDQNSANNRIDFNTAFAGTPNLIIRGPNGGRMSNFTICDAAAANGGTVSQGTKALIDLTAGSIDAMVDNFYMSRDAYTTAGGQATGKLVIGAGTLDVNNAYLGYQTGPGNGTGVGYCGAEVDVIGTNGASLFRVNGDLVLGYTVLPALTPFAAQSGYGQLVIGGGTVEASTISVGGPTAVSVENNITLTGGGTLVVTNTAGSAGAPVNTLSMSDSTLTLHVDGANTDPYVYVKTLVTGGAGNTLKLASVTGVSTYPATIHLISYNGSAAPNFTLNTPSGLYGFVLNNTANHTIDAVITTFAPASLVWNGDVAGGNWDTTTANWQGGLKFADGDSVTFNDTATGTKSVNVVGTVIPGSGGVLVDTASSYSIAGGTLAGTALITKMGSGSLNMSATSELPLTIGEGSVNNSGTIGATTVAAAASLINSGTVNGLTSSGTASSSKTVNIGLAVLDGTFVNSGTVNGTFALSGGTTTDTGSSTVEAVGISTVGTNTTLIHNGQFNNNTARLAISGNLTGSGTVSDVTGDAAGNNGRLEINPGGVFTPGGSNTIGTFTVEGRFDLNTGTGDGLMIVDVDLNNPQTNDYIVVDKWSNFRGALMMNNIGAVPFALGQSFRVFKTSFGTPNTPEAAFDLANKMIPASPGVGLQWNLSNLKTNGIITIVGVPTTPPALTSVATSTNLTLSWGTTNVGYQLQVQTNTLAIGLSTNWVPVVGSETNATYVVPITPENPTVFYRLSNQ